MDLFRHFPPWSWLFPPDVVSAHRYECYGVSCNTLNVTVEYTFICVGRRYIIYVFQGAGLTGTRGNLIADSVQYVLNVVLTVLAVISSCTSVTPTLCNQRLLKDIDSWGRRPMLVVGTLLMEFWLCFIGYLQSYFGEWRIVEGAHVWTIHGHEAVTEAIAMCSYLFVCSFAATMGPVSWTVC
jgi:hypothetical protein